MLGVVGVIAIETSVAAVTVSVIDPVIDPDVAEINVEPMVTDVTNPFDPAALLMAAPASIVRGLSAEFVRMTPVE